MIKGQLLVSAEHAARWRWCTNRNDGHASYRYGVPRSAASHAEHQVPRPSQVQDEVSGRQLVGLRPSVSRARQPHDLVVAGCVGKWNAKPTRRRGGQLKYSDLAIEAALTLRLLFRKRPARSRTPG
jgi:hypothetical protein